MRKMICAISAFFYAIGEHLNAALFGYMSRAGMVLHSVYIPNGSIVEIASSYGDATSMIAVSNADPAVATLESSHAIANGDFMEVTSGWGKLNGRILRAANLSTDDIDLEGFNSVNTTNFSAGAGIGSIREILAWTQLSQILEFTGEGGEQQFFNYQFLEEQDERRTPTNRSAAGVNIVVADDDSLAGYILCQEADEDRVARAVRITKPNGGLILFNAIITLAPMPQLEINNLGRARITFSLENPVPTKYAS